MECATPDADDGKFFPDAVDMESSDDSIDGNGSRSLSRPRWPSNGGGVSELCKGDAAYELGGNWRCELSGGRPDPD